MFPQVVTTPQRTWGMILNTSWSLQAFMVTLWAPALQCLPDHFTGRNWYQVTVLSCAALQRELEIQRSAGAIRRHSTPCLTRERWEKMLSQLRPKHLFPWSLHISHFSAINTGDIWVHTAGLYFLIWFSAGLQTSALLTSASLVGPLLETVFPVIIVLYF